MENLSDFHQTLFDDSTDMYDLAMHYHWNRFSFVGSIWSKKKQKQTLICNFIAFPLVLQRTHVCLLSELASVDQHRYMMSFLD